MCLTDSFCDALGDHNVYSFVHLRRATEVLETDSVIIAAARVSDVFLAGTWVETDLFPLLAHSTSDPETLLVCHRNHLSVTETSSSTAKHLPYYTGVLITYVCTYEHHLNIHMDKPIGKRCMNLFNVILHPQCLVVERSSSVVERRTVN